jgi:hypothetical protein
MVAAIVAGVEESVFGGQQAPAVNGQAPPPVRTVSVIVTCKSGSGIPLGHGIGHGKAATCAKPSATGLDFIKEFWLL